MQHTASDAPSVRSGRDRPCRLPLSSALQSLGPAAPLFASLLRPACPAPPLIAETHSNPVGAQQHAGQRRAESTGRAALAQWRRRRRSFASPFRHVRVRPPPVRSKLDPCSGGTAVRPSGLRSAGLSARGRRISSRAHSPLAFRCVVRSPRALAPFHSPPPLDARRPPPARLSSPTRRLPPPSVVRLRHHRAAHLTPTHNTHTAQRTSHECRLPPPSHCDTSRRGAFGCGQRCVSRACWCRCVRKLARGDSCARAHEEQGGIPQL